jgi:hypothetical protein
MATRRKTDKPAEVHYNPLQVEGTPPLLVSAVGRTVKDAWLYSDEDGDGCFTVLFEDGGTLLAMLPLDPADKKGLKVLFRSIDRDFPAEAFAETREHCHVRCLVGRKFLGLSSDSVFCFEGCAAVALSAEGPQVWAGDPLEPVN